MNNPSDWQEGGCHCGAVRFRARLPNRHAIECNCSMCAKKGMINVIVPAEDFELLSGAEALRTYRFNTGQAQHQFCCHCGIHPFSRPRSHPGSYDINGRCLDGGLAGWTIEPFDGQNWEENVAKIQ